MKETVIQQQEGAIQWIDLINPSEDEIQDISRQFRIESFFLLDSMNPEHFPRFDVLPEGIHFLILRIYDDQCTPQADTVRELTRKIALFYSPNFLITVHRRELDWLNALKKNSTQFAGKKNIIDALVTKIIQESVLQFEKPIQSASRCLESYEVTIFKDKNPQMIIEELYLTRRKAAVFLEMIQQIADLLPNPLFFQAANARNSSTLKRLQSETERLSFYSKKLYESISSLIHLHLSLASHRTNEVMRVLTVFSAFFLPLTFIVGIYGMNFKYMPELEQPYGYFAVIALMIAVSVFIFIWFRRRGWIAFK